MTPEQTRQRTADGECAHLRHAIEALRAEQREAERLRTALHAAGRVADLARLLAGGTGPNGRVAPADVHSVSPLCTSLQLALDDYDHAILEAGGKPVDY